MAVKIRLARGGRRKLARYRVVAADSRSPRDGRFIETLGYYNPQAQPKEFKLNIERIGYWLDQGAIVSQTVKSLMDQDRFAEKLEGIKKGLTEDALNIERKPEKVKKAALSAKAKAKAEEAAKAAAEAKAAKEAPAEEAAAE